MEIAISPCPNDTFLFYAWIQGLVGNIKIIPHFADISSLNEMARQKRFPLMKVSLAAFKNLRNYRLLPIGMALGYGVGPKVIGHLGKTVAIPGKDTTADLLFDHFFSGHEKIYCTYDQVLELLKTKAVDMGVIIHETRFTYAKAGFLEIADLGALWEKKYDLPLPLGGLVLRDDYQDKASDIISCIKESYFYAKKNPFELQEFILKYAQEKDPEVVKKHIELYVNEETFSVSKKGAEAVKLLLSI